MILSKLLIQTLKPRCQQSSWWNMYDWFCGQQCLLLVQIRGWFTVSTSITHWRSLKTLESHQIGARKLRNTDIRAYYISFYHNTGIRAGRYDQNLYHGIFLNYTGFTVFIFFMHDRVLTTFSTDWGKTAVDWLRMPYFSVMMSEYCRKSPH